MFHCSQAGQAGQVAQAGQAGQVAQVIHTQLVHDKAMFFDIKIISQLLSIHSILFTPVRLVASLQDKLLVYNFILVQVFISNNLVASSSLQSEDIIILLIV